MNIEHPAKVPIDALRANVSVSFEESRAMPPQVYTSKEFNKTIILFVQCRMYADIVCLHYSMGVDLLKL